MYISRVDNYLAPGAKGNTTRKKCCYHSMVTERKNDGYKIFRELLQKRGDHYKSTYTLLIPESDYNGKHVKYPIKCETHGVEFKYSMQN